MSASVPAELVPVPAAHEPTPVVPATKERLTRQIWSNAIFIVGTFCLYLQEIAPDLMRMFPQVKWLSGFLLLVGGIAKLSQYVGDLGQRVTVDHSDPLNVGEVR